MYVACLIKGQARPNGRGKGSEHAPMAEQTYDVLVLGGGTGGYVAAIRAAQLGLRVAVVEREKLGGTCLHKGCIPSKALLRSAEVLATVREGEKFGIRVAGAEVDFPAVHRRKEQIVEGLHKGVQSLMKKHRITVLQGSGALQPPSIFAPGGGVAVSRSDGEVDLISPEFIILATGSQPRPLPGLPFDGKYVLSSDHTLLREELPGSVIIVGGGAIGCEWASLYSDFGVQVTLVEALPHILPLEDAEVAAELARVFKKRKVNVIEGASVLADTYRQEGEGVAIDVEAGGRRQQLQADCILVAIGRAAVTQGVGIENFDKVKVERGVVVVDAQMRTGDGHIYAIGDVIGGLQLAHVAAHEGIIAAEAIAGREPHPLDYNTVPRPIYTRPEVCTVGLSEETARAAGLEVKTGKVLFRANGKAQIFGETQGFVKVVSDAATDDVLGVHIIGPHATDLIQSGALARFLNASTWELQSVVYPHPTLVEVLGEAALAVDGRTINV